MMVDGRLMGLSRYWLDYEGRLHVRMEAAIIVDGTGLFKTSVIVLFGGIVTSKSPFPAVAVWANTSLLITRWCRRLLPKSPPARSRDSPS